MMGRAPASSRGTDPPGCDWQGAWGTCVGPGWAWGERVGMCREEHPPSLWVLEHGRLRARLPAPGAPPQRPVPSWCPRAWLQEGEGHLGGS